MGRNFVASVFLFTLLSATSLYAQPKAKTTNVFEETNGILQNHQQDSQSCGKTGKDCEVCQMDGSCVVCKNKKYLSNGKCVDVCGPHAHGRGFGDQGRVCVAVARVRSEFSVTSSESAGGELGSALGRRSASAAGRGGQHSSSTHLSRGRRWVDNCAWFAHYKRNTGCNKGGCGDGEWEIDNSYCFWKAVYDETCEGVDYNNCDGCNGNFELRSDSQCVPCNVCGTNQYRQGSCSNTASGNYGCYDCGYFLVDGTGNDANPRRGAFTPAYSGGSYSVPSGTDWRTLSMISTSPTAPNSGQGWAQACRCPNNFVLNSLYLPANTMNNWFWYGRTVSTCSPVCRSGCSYSTGSCYDQGDTALCHCDYGWGGTNCDTRLVGMPFETSTAGWCQLSPGNTNLMLPSYYYGCDCSKPTSPTFGSIAMFGPVAGQGSPNCGQMLLPPLVPIASATVSLGSTTYPGFVSQCNVAECDPVNPSIPQYTKASVSYVKDGKGGLSVTASSGFRYAYDYTNFVPKAGVGGYTGEGVGDLDGSGPTQSRVGITTVAFGMFNMGTSPPTRLLSWTTTGDCASADKTNPLQGTAHTCAYNSTNSFIPTHLMSVMFFYRVRVDSQVYVVSPRKGTDITSYQSAGWKDVSSAETRNQASIVFDFTPPTHCSVVTDGSRCFWGMMNVSANGLWTQKVSVQPIFSIFAQGWRVPTGEAPIQKIRLLVYSIGISGSGLGANENDVLVDYTVNYYKNDLFTKNQTNRCQPPLICDANVPYNNPAVDNPPSDASTLPFAVSSVQPTTRSFVAVMFSNVRVLIFT